MVKRRELTKRQLVVIADMVAGADDEVCVLKKHRVSAHVYRKWLGNERFADELNFRIELVRREGMLAMARSAKKAAEMLAKLAGTGNGETARKACMDIMSFHEKEAGGKGKKRDIDRKKSEVKIGEEMARRIVAAMAR